MCTEPWNHYMLDNFAKLGGSNKKFHADFDSLPALPPREKFSVTIRVRRKSPLPPWSGQRMTHREHARLHGADPADFALIGSWAIGSRLSVVSTNQATREMVVRGTARAFQKAFSTDLRIADFNGQKRRVRQGEISIPAALAPVISSVTGLDNRPFAKPHYRVARSVAHSALAAAPAENAFTPVELATLYNFPEPFDGTGQTIAILELDGGFRPTELAQYFQEVGIRQPAVTVVPFSGGGANNPGVNALDPFCRDAEVMLDLQVAGAMAPGAKILVYFARDDSDESFLAAMSAIVHDSVNEPGIVSLSWGGPEPTATQQFRDQFNSLLESAAHLGITVCAATGDNAAPDFDATDPRWDHGAHVDFPACSPWALACGGTHVSVADGKIVAEEVWFEAPHDGAGGGVSRFLPLPDYQKNLAMPRAANPDGPVMRGVPDVAANASPGSGFRILCNGQTFPDPAKNVPPMGGTSAVAPLWAALVARLNQALGRNCGFLNPDLYKLAATPGCDVFRTPATGSNGTYSAAPGWNACTGLGIADGSKLLNALRGK